MTKEESIFHKLLYFQILILFFYFLLVAYAYFFYSDFEKLDLFNFNVTGLRDGYVDKFMTIEYFLGILIINFLSIIMLLKRLSAGAILYTFCIVFYLLFILFSGDAVVEPIFGFIDYLHVMAEGITLYLIFLTPMKKKFK